MQKKVLLGVFLVAIIICCSKYTFAAELMNDVKNTTNGIKNMMQNAENKVEDTAKNVMNSSKNATEDISRGMQNTENSITDNNINDKITGQTDSYNGNYTATRTSTGDNDSTLFGMNSVTWIWLIMAIVAISIIALVYAYSTTMNNTNHYNRDGE